MEPNECPKRRSQYTPVYVLIPSSSSMEDDEKDLKPLHIQHLFLYLSHVGIELGDCFWPIDSGEGSKPRTMWAYKPRECVPFNYSEPGGNASHFKSKEKCEEICSPFIIKK
ncbi:unnamed protein product [Dibothriocephalus latus]|uniref:BPTI/Kunitz inhibitor domain-containing protein n=1 Tax=Dibothriocephalus latus TaxID=60516 RepID=A0A3P7LVR4_DIBLA|nr:unnamed protein product [Dibothriocephalus latus]